MVALDSGASTSTPTNEYQTSCLVAPAIVASATTFPGLKNEVVREPRWPVIGLVAISP